MTTNANHFLESHDNFEHWLLPKTTSAQNPPESLLKLTDQFKLGIFVGSSSLLGEDLLDQKFTKLAGFD